jgi:hypothetical protein
MEKVDRDKEIGELYNKMIKVIDISRLVRGEFEKVSFVNFIKLFIHIVPIQKRGGL